MGRKQLTTYQRWIIAMGLFSLIIASFGVMTGVFLHQLDPNGEITIPTHTPTTNGDPLPPPVYHKPVLLLESVVVDPDVNSAEFQISVSYPEYVVYIGIHYYVDGIEDSHTALLDNPISGVHQTTIQMDEFDYCVPTSAITIYLMMAYINEQGSVEVERADDVATFSFLIDDEQNGDLPDYFPPEIIPETFEYLIEDTILTFGVSFTYHELINSMGCYFVIDSDIFEIYAGEDYVIGLDHIDAGFYQSSFNYTIFPVDVEVYLYLVVSYVTEDESEDSYIIEELTYFEIDTSADGIGVNYLPIIIIAIVVISAISITKTIKAKKGDEHW